MVESVFSYLPRCYTSVHLNMYTKTQLCFIYHDISDHTQRCDPELLLSVFVYYIYCEYMYDWSYLSVLIIEVLGVPI